MNYQSEEEKEVAEKTAGSSWYLLPADGRVEINAIDQFCEVHPDRHGSR